MTAWRVLICALGSAAVTILFGLYRTWRGVDGWERWLHLASTTSCVVAVIVAMDAVAIRRASDVLEAFLVLSALFALLLAGVAAYWPARELMNAGWFVSVPEIARWWGVLCGGPFVVIGYIWNRRVLAKSP